VCQSIVSGQISSLDNTSSGLLSVMQELSRQSSRREAAKSTIAAEADWTKKIVNFAPYGQCIMCLNSELEQRER